jgi:alanyl aminopeptidase
VRPIRESLALDIDPARDRFTGTADIALHLDQPRAAIWLHGRGLTVRSAELALASGARIAARWEEVDPTGVVRVTPAQPLAEPLVGDVALRVAFEAAYDPQLVGVYRTTTPAGPAVFSKFEAIYARRAFPCFDEPAFKLPYEVTLTVPSGAQVIGNMPVAETAPAGDGKTRVRFQPTPPLPSYLVAFAVGPFDRRDAALPPSPVRPAALPISGVAIRGRGGDTAFAIAEARALVAEQERYFGIGFPFPKLDLIAVPDFQSGAMENAGAITFRDSRLLIDERTASLADRIAVTSVIAHEAAHQWFGDYVTMKWWDDLWLNEGFATFLDTLTLRAVRPELEAELVAANRTHMVMNLDGLASARRIRQPIETTHDITNAFDGITYEKGAAVLTMLEHFVGNEPFRRGLHDFLTEHATGNATTDDLIRAVGAAAKRDLAPLVGSFLDQPGVPVVGATSRCTGGRGAVDLTQAAWRVVGAGEPPATRWTIPVCIRYGTGGPAGRQTGQVCSVLDGPTGSVELPACADWILANADAAGYYRSALSAGDLARLLERGASRLSTVERVALGHDLEAAFASGAMPGGEVLRALEPLARDRHGAVALVPRALLGFVDDYAVDPGAPGGEPDDARRRIALRARIAKLYAPAVAQLGWTPSPQDRPWRRKLRTELLGFLALRIDDPAVLGEATRRGRRLLGLDRAPGAARGPGRPDAVAPDLGLDRARGAARGPGRPDAVAPDLADIALGAAVRSGGSEAFDAVLAEATGAQDALIRHRALLALAQARDPALVRRALDLALDPRLRKNERLVALGGERGDTGDMVGLLGAAETRDAAWAWLVAHFDELAPQLPDRFAGRIPGMIRLCDARRAEEVRAFFAPRVGELTGGPRNLAQALEASAQCVARVAAQRKSIQSYIDAR